jgi:succinylglutamate desuccinylase
MHGDERVGADLIADLVQGHHPIWETDARHKSILFAIGNPRALQENLRARPGGEDLNRMFGPNSVSGAESTSYETQRVDALKSALSETDILIDLHQTTCPSPPVAVIPPHREHKTLAALLGIKIGVFGAEDTYDSSMITDWFNERGGVGVTIETGKIGTPEARECARAVLHNYLSETWSLTANDHTIRLYQIREAMRAPGDRLAWTRHLGNTSPVHAGETIATTLEGSLVVLKDSATFLPQNAPKKGETCVLLADDLGPQRCWEP